jgi:hypothetical protein
MEEYLTELFLASSARSLATYSSELMSLEDGMLMSYLYLLTRHICTPAHIAR